MLHYHVMVGGGIVESNSMRSRTPSVFKTVLGPDNPPYVVENTGIEPVVPEAADLQSTASPLMLLLRCVAPV